MKILSVNANYFLGYDGSARSYSKAHRWIKANKVEDQSMEKMADILADEQPDVVCLIEADQGSLLSRDQNHVERIAEKCEERGLQYSYDYHNKYGNWLSKLPKFEDVSNSVMWKKDAVIEPHYLSYGTKQLMHEVRFDDVSIFSVHLPLAKKTREKQLRKMAEIIDEREKAIVTGDFNNYHGLEELEELLEMTDLQVCETGKTFPAYNPRFMLDFFLVTPNIEINDSRVVDEYFSDHKAIVLDAEVTKPLRWRVLPKDRFENAKEKVQQVKSEFIAAKMEGLV